MSQLAENSPFELSYPDPMFNTTTQLVTWIGELDEYERVLSLDIAYLTWKVGRRSCIGKMRQLLNNKQNAYINVQQIKTMFAKQMDGVVGQVEGVKTGRALSV